MTQNYNSEQDWDKLSVAAPTVMWITLNYKVKKFNMSN